MARILHVTECLNAGISTAIETILVKEKNHSHFILFDGHHDSPIEIPKTIQDEGSENSLFFWGGGYFRKIQILRKTIRNTSPDIIHAHSTLAGMITRIFIRNVAIYYSPHCFAFQKTDVNFFTRCVAFLVEKILSSKSQISVSHWPIEEQIFGILSDRVKIVRYPLVLLGDLKSGRAKARFNDKHRFHQKDFNVSFVGRMRPQKDPNFFVEVSKRFPNTRIHFSWIGEGDKKYSSLIGANKIDILPWINNSDKELLYKQMDVLLVSSAWESGPLVLFEALQYGVPAVVRTRPYNALYGFETYESVEECAEIIQNLCDSPKRMEHFFESQVSQVLKLEFFQEKMPLYG